MAHSSPSNNPIVKLFRKLGPSAVAGIVLVTVAAIAMVWANSPYQHSYHAIWQNKFTIGSGVFTLSKPLELWINDALMAVFFFLVGLEIKREVLGGTLSSVRRAALPVLAAVGGMVVPAGIYYAMNAGAETGDVSGWAIPSATDIAFALGIISLLGKRVPVTLKIFLTAVAVVDDLGAVLVIALFYTSQISWIALGIAGAVMAGLVGINRLGVRHPIPYLLLGAVMWVALLKSGVHCTISGVLVAMTIPSAWVAPEDFIGRATGILHHQDAEDDDELAPSTAIHHVRQLCNDCEPPLIRYEHALEPWVQFFIMPVFAFANAGVTIGDAGIGAMFTPIGLGVALGLFLGKPIGITLFSYIAVKSGIADKPEDFTWKQLHGAAWLGGIGFTMALFVANLAFTDAGALTSSKIGLIAGSFFAGIIGSGLLYAFAQKSDVVELAKPVILHSSSAQPLGGTVESYSAIRARPHIPPTNAPPPENRTIH